MKEGSSKTESPSQPNSGKMPPDTFTHLLTQPRLRAAQVVFHRTLYGRRLGQGVTASFSRPATIPSRRCVTWHARLAAVASYRQYDGDNPGRVSSIELHAIGARLPCPPSCDDRQLLRTSLLFGRTTHPSRYRDFTDTTSFAFSPLHPLRLPLLSRGHPNYLAI